MVAHHEVIPFGHHGRTEVVVAAELGRDEPVVHRDVVHVDAPVDDAHGQHAIEELHAVVAVPCWLNQPRAQLEGARIASQLAATGDERSPLFGAGNAGVVARDGRLFRRDDESRSESYGDILARAGLAEIEARGNGAADPAAQTSYVMRAHGAVFAEVKVDPELALRSASARFRGRVESAERLATQAGAAWDELTPDDKLTYYAQARMNEPD